VNEVTNVDDSNKIAITIKGVPSTQSSAFRSVVTERYGTYIVTALNSTDYSMQLKPTELIDLKADTVKRAIDTIGNRIDQLGLAEKSVQPYGQSSSTYQILIQLPGVDDPARAKELIGTAAVLEIAEVKDGPYPTKEAGIAAHGGMLPIGTKLAMTKARGAGDSGQWYLIAKTPVVSGREMRVPAKTNFGSLKPVLTCRPKAASGSDAGRKRISATSWRWFWTIRW
jgi:preprotein translocase subunit SecD